MIHTMPPPSIDRLSPESGEAARAVSDADRRLALAAQADLALLVAEAFRRPPTDRHRDPPAVAWATRWQSLTCADLDGLLNASRLADERLVGLTREVLAHARGLDPRAHFDEYCRLFEGASSCPATEASYIRRDKGAILGDVCGFYRAFGWTFRPQHGERADHIVCELEFVAVLLGMASQTNEAEKQAIALEGLAQFVQGHLADWISSYCWQLCSTTELPFFAAAAAWTESWWQALTHYHGWPIAESERRHGAPSNESDDGPECGAPQLIPLLANRQGEES